MPDTRKIKILFVHHFAGIGGATMSLLYLVERLDRRKFDIEVLFLGKGGEVVQRFEQLGIVVRLLEGIVVYPHAYGAYMSYFSRKPIEPLRRLFKLSSSVEILRKFFATHQYDIVHVNTSLLLPVGKAAKLAGMKVVWHVRENLHNGVFGLRKLFIRHWLHKYADWIFTISSFERDRIGTSDKVQIVHNYVDFDFFDKNIEGHKIRTSLGISNTDFVVCNLGGAVHSKGADVFVEAAGLLARKYKDMKFLLVGIVNPKSEKRRSIKNQIKKLIGLKFDLSGRVHALIEKHALKDRLILTGVRTDIPGILAASDLLAWSATQPHFARPIIEAGAMGKAAVASNFPNTMEALTPGVTGLLFKPGDANDLADKIETLYLDRKLKDDLGQAGFLLAHSKFNAQFNFSLIEEVYGRILEKNKK